ncbi:MAG: hypothetical protein PF447_11240 [Spirochaetaceae bacterium]|jgi:hypothetical protein|nr:hypothetical protein [Spirochaetaceae bacterium]
MGACKFPGFRSSYQSGYRVLYFVLTHPDISINGYKDENLTALRQLASRYGGFDATNGLIICEVNDFLPRKPFCTLCSMNTCILAPGFLNGYCQADIYQDNAEIFYYLLIPSLYTSVEFWLQQSSAAHITYLGTLEI